MNEYKEVREYVTVREITIFADSIEAARDKLDRGDWHSSDEVEIDFWWKDTLEELYEVKDE